MIDVINLIDDVVDFAILNIGLMMSVNVCMIEVNLLTVLPSAEHGHCLPPVDAAALALRTFSAPVVLVLAAA